MIKIGIIGGSGLYNPDILHDPNEINIETPYGKPSSTFTCGQIKGVDIAILARHGKQEQSSSTARIISCRWGITDKPLVADEDYDYYLNNLKECLLRKKY